MIVIDASVALAWTFPDEQENYAGQVLSRATAEGALVPPIWTLEIANAHVVAERRKRLTRKQSEASLALLARLPIRVAPHSAEADFGQVVMLARAHQLSAYDAAYLELAHRSTAELATLDARLLSAASKLGVRLVSA